MRVIGWILFVYGICGAIYVIAAAPPIGIIGGLLLAALCIWGGWQLAHRKQGVTYLHGIITYSFRYNHRGDDRHMFKTILAQITASWFYVLPS